MLGRSSLNTDRKATVECRSNLGHNDLRRTPQQLYLVRRVSAEVVTSGHNPMILVQAGFRLPGPGGCELFHLNYRNARLY